MKICGVRFAPEPMPASPSNWSTRIESGVIAHADGHGVAALHEAVDHGLPADEFAVRVAGIPAARRAFDLAGAQRRVFDQRSRQQSATDGGGIDKGFHRGADLPLALRCAVEFALPVVATADDRDDAAGVVVDHRHRALEIGRGGNFVDPIPLRIE